MHLPAKQFCQDAIVSINKPVNVMGASNTSLTVHSTLRK